MPIYEYQCQQCGERSEVLQRISADPLTRCESCGGDLKKLISAPAFQFKGSGWYVTDYARKDGGGKDSGGGNQGGSKSESTGSASDGSSSSSSSSDASKSGSGSAGKSEGSSSKSSASSDS